MASGSFGSYQIVSEVAAIPIDKDIPFPQASLIGCGVTTGVGAAINTAQVEPGTTAAVFGAGGVGLNVIQGCRIAGATTIIAVDLLDNKLDMAREFGATHTVNAGEEDAVEAIKSLTGGYGVHYAFEAIGLVEKPFIQSIQCTRNRGMSIWVGHAPHGTPVTIDARDLMMEKIIMGSLYGSGQPLDYLPSAPQPLQVKGNSCSTSSSPAPTPSNGSTTPSKPSARAKSPGAPSPSTSG